ncbi:2'-5' RNA ligase family protein [Winogradskya consettensis]|uniref:2'-5' RNA ligase family protein n=1 Tax=Winogradskya consettensis TaxID=113560 RepID=A0A919T0V4_9ACTN|nr:2'-5' RNA ligase family protein [Actinoplanes consettensis]GIM83549.1 hypothetical protein Aco04nite_87110 [Actinoplanes consettensis]
MHTVELLPDEQLEAGVRHLWSLLAAAGLPSLATHPHPTNRPHLTMITAESLQGLSPLRLPVAAELGRVRILGRALVREVTPTAELRALQTAIWTSLTAANPWPPPPDFVPHVSLALKITETAHDEALHLLADLPPARGSFVAARSYNSQTRTVTEL